MLHIAGCIANLARQVRLDCLHDGRDDRKWALLAGVVSAARGKPPVSACRWAACIAHARPEVVVGEVMVVAVTNKFSETSGNQKKPVLTGGTER